MNERAARRRLIAPALLLAPLVAFLLFFFVAPFVMNLLVSVRPGLGHYARLATDPYYLRVIGQTFALKYPGTLASLVLADTTSRIPAEAAPTWQDRIRTAQEKGMKPLVEPTLARWFTEPYRKAAPQTMQRIGALIGTRMTRRRCCRLSVCRLETPFATHVCLRRRRNARVRSRHWQRSAS